MRSSIRGTRVPDPWACELRVRNDSQPAVSARRLTSGSAARPELPADVEAPGDFGPGRRGRAVAQPFAVLQAGGTVLGIGVVLGTLTTARILLLPIGGGLADRYSRRRVMISRSLEPADPTR
jgi:hypothetical protein